MSNINAKWSRIFLCKYPSPAVIVKTTSVVIESQTYHAKNSGRKYGFLSDFSKSFHKTEKIRVFWI